MGWEEEFIQGDSRDCNNTFQWLNIFLNLPGDSEYSPSLTWVSNITKEGKLTSGFCNYINDIRSIVSSEGYGWVVSKRISTYFTYLVIQDSIRKKKSLYYDYWAVWG